jgi:hypothetical protein
MTNNPFKRLKDRKSTFSDNPKTISNRKHQKQKRGLDIALHRTQSNFRVRKSRALKRLAASNEWANLAHSEQEKKKKKVIVELEAERESAQAEIEREWFKKVDAGEIEEEEDDMMELDREEDDDAESGSREDEMEGTSNQGGLIVNSNKVAEDESDQWETTDDEGRLDTLANDIAAMKEGSGKAIIERVVKKSEAKAAL